jgi:hypothetical protein
MSWMNATLPNPTVNGYPGALQFAGYGPDSCQCRTYFHIYPKNFQPRLGLAYSIDTKTVVRAAYTINASRYGAVGGNEAKEGLGTLGYAANPTDATLNGGVTPAFYWQNGFPAYQTPPVFSPTLNTGYYAAPGTGATVQGGTVLYGDPKYGERPPYYINWNVDVQRQLAPSISLDVAYIGGEGHYLNGGSSSTPSSMAVGPYSDQMSPRYLALGNLLNAQAAPANVAAAAAIIPGIALPYSNFSGTISQMLRPFPQYASVTDVWGDVGNLNYQSLQVIGRDDLSHGLTAMLNLTWAKELDDLNTYTAYINDKSQSNNPAVIINALMVYQLPFGRDRQFLSHSGRAVSALISGWQLSGITAWRSGTGLGPVTASCTLPNAGTCLASYNPAYSGPALTKSYGSGNPATTAYIAPGAFENPAPYTYGNTPRTFAYGLRGPTYFNQNLSLSRDFAIHDRAKLTIRADSTNVFNDVSFSAPSVTFGSSSFGTITSQSNSPRNLQFMARFTF